MLTVSPDCSAVSASEHLLLRVLVRIATLFFSVIKIEYAGMAELADALDSGSSESNFIQVQVLLPAPIQVFAKDFANTFSFETLYEDKEPNRVFATDFSYEHPVSIVLISIGFREVLHFI